MSDIIKKGLGWQPDKPDSRDFLLAIDTAKVPDVSVYLFDRKNSPPIYDQGNLGSCVGQGVAGLCQFILMNKSPLPPNPNAKLFFPSALFIYYYARQAIGTVNIDSGATIRDGIKVVAKRGTPSIEKWPYIISKFRDEPSEEAKKQALSFQTLRYYRIGNNKKSLIGALLKGFPIVFGFRVYESFMTREVQETGIAPMPKAGERLLGGHCAVIWAYNKEGDYFLVRNSWGENWGINGYFKIPAKYLTDHRLADDFWVIESMIL